jgi:predicted nucleic acid-binding protein
VAVGPFLDTSVLLAGLVDFGPQSAPAQEVLHAVAEGKTGRASTAWHCCLEVYSVATRLPPEYRITAADAVALIREEILGRMAVHGLPDTAQGSFLQTLAQQGITGGRVYDAHIAEIARSGGATVIVTDNRKHFLAALRHGIRVETPSEFVAAFKKS